MATHRHRRAASYGASDLDDAAGVVAAPSGRPADEPGDAGYLLGRRPRSQPLPRPTGHAPVGGRLRREHVEAFIAGLLERLEAGDRPQPLSGSPVFFGWLVDEGEIRETPMARMKPPRLARGAARRSCATPSCAGCSRSASATSPFAGRRDEAIIRVFDRHRRPPRRGPRPDRSTTSTSTTGLLRVTGKGSRTRVVVVGAQTVRAFDRYLRAQRSIRRRLPPTCGSGARAPLLETGFAELVRDRGRQASLDDAPSSPRLPARLRPLDARLRDAGVRSDGSCRLEEPRHGGPLAASTRAERASGEWKWAFFAQVGTFTEDRVRAYFLPPYVARKWTGECVAAVATNGGVQKALAGLASAPDPGGVRPSLQIGTKPLTRRRSICPSQAVTRGRSVRWSTGDESR